MKKTLKELRKINNLSQQELSDVSGVSIRTIQRIEKKLSSGSPFILKSLCKALNIDVSDLDIEPIDGEETLQDAPISAENTPDRHLNWINLSALFVIFLPLLNLVFPVLLFLKFKNQENNQSTASKILSFQILWTLITLLLMFLIPALLTPFFEALSTGRFPFFVLVYYLSVVVNVFVIIGTAVKLNKSQEILRFVPNIL
jgi:transcriptional regulator with XRE-family HTH domain